ncbi:hypothetical protein WH47_11191 [Habropoda laboriosa]|uniref:Transposable element Tc3 transposase n=1 Tax=Habropoda laboriosa TaxID=597456 RepID=A0A0L7RAA8_9HYME|nr:hypothetical protein WH47_11191 [Habropoda laboriosa]
MHDGAHFSRLARLINGRGGRINWPARSPDLNPLDFYLWGHLKSLVCNTPVNNIEELRYRIQESCRRIQTLGTFERARRSMISYEKIERVASSNNFYENYQTTGIVQKGL